MASGVSAIILAAGNSRRMGAPKLLLPLDHGTVIERTVDNYLASDVAECLVVVGEQAAEITRLLKDRLVRIVLNADYQKGMSTSIAAGLRSVNQKSTGAMVCLGDQPFVFAATIDRLIQAFVSSGKLIALPVHEGKPGHPVIFAPSLWPELLAAHGDIGGRDIIRRYADSVLKVSVDCPGVISDIDTPDQYRQAQEMASIATKEVQGEKAH